MSTQFDVHCDKLAVERHSSEVLSTQLTDDRLVYHTLSVHLCRAKLMTYLDDRHISTWHSIEQLINQSIKTLFQADKPRRDKVKLNFTLKQKTAKSKSRV